MKKPRKAKILWLVKKAGKRTTIIGFLRDRSERCLIVGGPTGSHYAGHGESWEEKWKEYAREGYVDIYSAIKKKILSSDWRPPKISKNDQVIIDMILHKKTL